MKEIFQNGIVQGVIVALIVAFIFWVIRHFKFKHDEKTLINFLGESKRETSHTFRTTHAISSATNLSEERIRKVCNKSKKITRNQREKESWKLSD